MQHREESFRSKFADAARALGVSPAEVASLKVREIVTSNSEYQDLLRTLERDLDMAPSDIDGNFQGRAHLFGDRRARVIVVEHETGLEILFVAGSVASLISVIPLILQAWRAIRSLSPRRHHRGIHGIETRRFDDQGRLHEEPLHDALDPHMLGFGGMNLALATVGHLIESRVNDLAGKLQSLTSRVDLLEKRLDARTTGRKPSPKKKAGAGS